MHCASEQIMRPFALIFSSLRSLLHYCNLPGPKFNGWFGVATVQTKTIPLSLTTATGTKINIMHNFSTDDKVPAREYQSLLFVVGRLIGQEKASCSLLYKSE